MDSLVHPFNVQVLTVGKPGRQRQLKILKMQPRLSRTIYAKGARSNSMAYCKGNTKGGHQEELQEAASDLGRERGPGLNWQWQEAIQGRKVSGPGSHGG